MKREGDTNECVCNKCSSSSLRWFLRCRKWREFITSSRELHHRPADRRRTFFLLLLYYAWGELPASKPSSAAYLREERGSFRPALVEIVSSACALSTIIQIETERIMQHFFIFRRLSQIRRICKNYLKLISPHCKKKRPTFFQTARYDISCSGWRQYSSAFSRRFFDVVSSFLKSSPPRKLNKRGRMEEREK